jgi:hypothetical protein
MFMDHKRPDAPLSLPTPLPALTPFLSHLTPAQTLGRKAEILTENRARQTPINNNYDAHLDLRWNALRVVKAHVHPRNGERERD